MDRKAVLKFWWLALLVILPAAADANLTASAPVFENTLSISPWHVHLSQHRFPAAGGGNAIMRITTLVPSGAVLDGILTLNGRIIHLKPYFIGAETVFAIPVVLLEDNRLIVFLWGTPGAGIKLDVLRENPLGGAPLILGFEADPPIIQRGQASLLQWHTAQAERCELQPGIGIVEPSGSLLVYPNETVGYTLTAIGAGEPANASLTIVVENSAPVAEPQHVTTLEDAAVPIFLRGYDGNGDPLAFQIQNDPTHGTLSGEPPELIYHPNPNFAGVDSFSFTVTDGSASSAAALVTIAIQTTNDPPTADAGSDQTVDVGEWVTLDGQRSKDMDGDVLTYQWAMASTPSGSLAFLTNPGSANAAFVPDKAGSYRVQLIVHDGIEPSAPAFVTITANPAMVLVPDVTGLALNQAQARVADARLSVGSIAEAHHPILAAGLIVSQIPAAGAMVEEGSPIRLVVSLGPLQQSPVATFQAVPSTIAQGSAAVLTWATAYAQKVHIDHGIGEVAASGSVEIIPDHTTLYTLTVVGDHGTISAAATVQVTRAPLPQPDNSFGQFYEDLIPPDAALEQHDPRRFSVVTGVVLNAQGQPLASVDVTIHGRPEYGTAGTDAEGRFSLPVEGGGTLTVLYRKPGLIAVQRQVHVAWNDTAVVETVRMVAPDATATTITFDGSASSAQVHRSSELTDADGGRSCTLVFSGDNRVYLADESGNRVMELKTITARTTEYRTPESMPARLPPASAFTWCAEFSVDGAERVQFEKPVVVWVDNFLGFPVGEIVPVGYYDRDQARWRPMNNGQVVMLLDTDGDGTVDALDADGDGRPDDLDQNGSTHNEVLGLTDNRRYVAGSIFWRVAVTHFSPIDLNWPFGLPPGAIPPNPAGQAFTDLQQEEGRDSRQCLGSFLEEKSRVFHEDIPIPGTDLKLHYTSSRTAGFKPGLLTIPASGDSVPGGLIRIVVKAEVAGREYELTLPPEPNQVAQIEWDGLDHLGRPVSGTVMAHIQIGFVYYGVYYQAARIGNAFAQAGLDSLMIPTRREAVAWRSVELPIIRGMGTIAEGWSLSAHHYVSPLDASRLFKGDGTIGAHNTAVIETVAGDGTSVLVFGGMGGLAIQAQIGEPYGVDTDEAGNLYIASTKSIPYSHMEHHVLKVDRKGIVTDVGGFLPSGMASFARDRQGNCYHSWSYYNCIYKVDPQYALTTYGVCNPNYGSGFSGDGGPATAARFDDPAGISVDLGGNVYIADKYNHRIRKIDPNGIITTFAGTGAAASSGDGGLATAAGLAYPVSVAVDAYGNIFVAEGYTRRVRKIDPSGTIVTVAGNGTSVFKGNGYLATETGFYSIRSISVDKNGNLYIVSEAGNRVYKVDAAGIVSTVAGSGPMGIGQGGFEGDGGAAVAARLDYPAAVAVDPAGQIYIADQYNERVRRVGPPSARLAALMDQSDIAFSEENGLGHILTSAGQHKMTVDLATGVVLREFFYDSDNRLTAIADAYDNRIVIERGAGGVPTAIVSPDGIRTGLFINSANQLTGVVYPNGSTYAFQYSADGLELFKIDPAGNRFGHRYDRHGRLTDYTDDEAGHWQLSNQLLANGDIRHEALTAEGGLTTHLDRYPLGGGYQSTTIDAAGAQTMLDESADGLAMSSTLACGLEREYLYGVDSQFKYKYLKQLTEQSGSSLSRAAGFERRYSDSDADGIPDVITSSVTVNGRISSLVHDILRARKTFSSAEGRSLVVEYNPDTLATERLQAPGLLDTTYAYDGRGRLIATTVGSRSISFAYNSQGMLGSVIDPIGRQTFYEYDAVGRTTGITRPDGSFIDFVYDRNGNLSLLVNPAGVSHEFGHNRVNEPSEYRTPLSGNYQYRYDRDRRPTETILPSGKTIRNVYDQGLLVRTETPEASIYFNYLCGSKIGSISKDGEGIAYAYDGILLTSETMSGTFNQTISYSYDNDFELIQATYAGESTGYGYDRDGLLTQAGAYSIARQAGSGFPLQVSSAGLQISRAFNGYGELESQAVTAGGRTFSSYSLQRDNSGTIVRKNEVVGGVGALYEYGYDAAGRLLQVFRDGVLVEEYQYDESGARISEVNTLRGIPRRSYIYSDEDHLLAAGVWTYQYDPDGFLTAKANPAVPAQRTAYSYSSRGELLAALLPDGKRIEYVCDPLGRRIAKRVNGALTEKYLWQGTTRLLAVYDGAGSLRMRFEYADDRLPVAMTAGGVSYYLGYDQVGSLIAVADGSGRVIKKISYDSFGNILEDTQPSFALPLGFAGGLHDRDTGLVRFGFRDYDPEVGRWTAKDPIGFAGGDTDLYGYVLNDPVNWVDPIGQYADLIIDVGFILWDLKNLFDDPCNRGDNFAALGLDIIGAVVPFATGLGAGYRASKSLKPIVIGENMRDRVIPYAKGIGGDWYKPRSNRPDMWLTNNERWLKAKMAEGREIIDIGIDPLRTTRSPYYEAEKKLIFKNNYNTTLP